MRSSPRQAGTPCCCPATFDGEFRVAAFLANRELDGIARGQRAGVSALAGAFKPIKRGRTYRPHHGGLNRPYRRAANNFFSEFLDRKPELWHSDLSLDERRLTRRRKAAVPASHGENEGIRLKGRDREIIVRHEGLAPVRLSLKLETGSGFFSGRNSCLTSGRSSVLSPVLGLFARSPVPSVFAREPLGRQVGKWRHEFVSKTAPALRFASRSGGTRG